MGTEYNLISTDAQRALEEFSQDFAAALVNPGVQEWAKQFGLYRASRALKTTYPIPVSSAGYTEFKGDMRYRSLFEKSLSLTPKTYQDGVSELASIIEAPDFIGWTTEPQAIAAGATSLMNEVIVTLLEANGTCWDGKTFFAADHPYNVFKTSVGTFDNDVGGAGTTLTAANVKTAKTSFRKIKGANGKPLGLKLTHLLVPSALEETAREIRDRDLVVESSTIGAVNNLLKGTFEIIVSDELTSDSVWYALALNKPGMYPWIVQDEGAPEEIRLDKTSDYYKTTLKVAISYVLRGGGALALPHCVQKWAGSA
jgi:phage major head subunit gpT-like protein